MYNIYHYIMLGQNIQEGNQWGCHKECREGSRDTQ